MQYIKRSAEGITVIDGIKTEMKYSLKKYLNIQCLKNGSSYDGRVSSMKFLLHRKGLVPLYVTSDVLLLFTRNIRNWDVVVVNFHTILSLRKSVNGNTVVLFDDCSELVLNVSLNRFKKQYELASTLKRLLS